MKHIKTILIAGLTFILAAFGGALADDMDHSSCEQHSSMDHSTHGTSEMNHSPNGHAMKEMGHTGHMGENIRNASVDGYTFTYHLIDMRKKMKATGHQHEMKMTHHMMVYVTPPHGDQIESAKVGYLVVGPDEKNQKLMCMGMGGGFGADVDFAAPGTYTIKTKVMDGDKKLMDSFNYTVK